MRYAKLFSLLVFATMALYGAAGFYCLPLAGFEGDLTRIGKLPESLFGWTRPQPAIQPELMQQSSWQEADVLVIGDSFSEPRVWQTVLTGHGLRVRTEHWPLGRICADFTPWLQKRGFHGKYVVLEIVERNVKDIPESLACKKMQLHYGISANQSHQPPLTQVDRGKADYSGRMSVGIQTWMNMRAYEREGKRDFGVMVEPVASGCALFSHTRCEDALFLGKADHAGDYGAETLQAMETVGARINGPQVIWAIVPDKSTTYLHPDKNFWNAAAQRLHAPNLLSEFRQALTHPVVDLYPANNTHLSTTGYLLMGEAIYRNLSERATDWPIHVTGATMPGK